MPAGGDPRVTVNELAGLKARKVLGAAAGLSGGRWGRNTRFRGVQDGELAGEVTVHGCLHDVGTSSGFLSAYAYCCGLTGAMNSLTVALPSEPFHLGDARVTGRKVLLILDDVCIHPHRESKPHD